MFDPPYTGSTCFWEYFRGYKPTEGMLAILPQGDYWLSPSHPYAYRTADFILPRRCPICKRPTAEVNGDSRQPDAGEKPA